MHFRKNVFSIFAATIVLTAFCASQSAAEEEKSLWQRFVDWFKPAPSLEGEGPLYDELRELEIQIDRIEGRYSRERRPGNKTRLKKEMEDLKTKREKLIDRIREEEKGWSRSITAYAPNAFCHLPSRSKSSHAWAWSANALRLTALVNCAGPPVSRNNALAGISAEPQ